MRAVAIGGGRGLATSLRALRTLTDDLTAVVSTADDGGSTGRLRRSTSQAAPGDLRKCLVAMAEPNSALARAMQFRFDEGELDGHALGNLVLSAMTEVCGGLIPALDELSKLLGVRGRVLPATVEHVDLVATTIDGRRVEGQVAIMGTTGIDRVQLSPRDARVAPDVLEAIASADVIMLGPGSLYTSVLAATAVPAVTEALAAAPGHLMYVCNLAPQQGETEGYGVAEHVAALARHGLNPRTVIDDPTLAADGGDVHDPRLLAVAIRDRLAIGTQNLIP